MNFYEKLKLDIGVNRYNHSIRVRDTAVKLAKIYKCDINKALVAGLLHDCGKFYDKDYLLKQAFEFGIISDESYISNRQIIHAPLGAYIAHKEYGIEDKEILDAIRYHTTGRDNMTLLEKIIYIADYIEPQREFVGLDELRDLAWENINAAILKALNDTIIHLINSGSRIHIYTINARNYLIKNIK